MVQNATGATLLFFPERTKDWSQKELAEFYRVESALTQSGLHISSERGLSDEGDPWFVFFRISDHEPIVHFARIDGVYIIASAAYDGVAKGKNFRDMIFDLLSRHRLNNEALTPKSNIFFHPAALLITVVGLAFFKTPSSAKADDGETTPHREATHQGLNGNIKKNGVADTDNSKSSSLPKVVFDAVVRPQLTSAPADSWSAEMTSVLVSAIAELSPIEKESSYSLDGSNPSDAGDAPLAGTFKIGAKQKGIIVRDDLIPISTFSPETYDSADAFTTYQASEIFDAFTLLGLLNAIPVSSGPIDVKTLLKLSKPIGQNSDIEETSFINSIENNPAIVLQTAEASTLTKINLFSNGADEKAQKEAGVAHDKLETVSSHHPDFSSINTNITTINLTATINLGHKSETVLPPSLALSILNEIDHSFNFSKWISDTPVTLNENFYNISDSIFFQSLMWGYSAALGNFSQNHFLTVVDNKIHINQISAHDEYLVYSSSNNWEGEGVENLLKKFLQTYPNANFTLKTENEFTFQTTASQTLTENIDRIIISFEDGSHINIIGSKQEIANIMAWN